MTNRKNFLLYIDHLQATLPLLTMEERGELFTALTAHALDAEVNITSDKALMAYNIMAGAMDANFEKYEKTVEKRRAAAQVRYNNDANACKSMQVHANAGDTDTVTDTDTKTVTKTVTDTDTVTDTLYESNGCIGANAPTTTKTVDRAFKKPTVEEVQSYCEAGGYNVDAEAFVDYYETTGWKVGRNSMKDWRAAVRTWARKKSKRKPSMLDDMSWAIGLEDKEAEA